MSIIFNEEGLQDVNPPCVCQEFVNHNAVLYKVNQASKLSHICQLIFSMHIVILSGNKTDSILLGTKY